MRSPPPRLELARAAYAAAIRATRERSTPHTWARLLRAARNLRDASGEDEARAVAEARRRDS